MYTDTQGYKKDKKLCLSPRSRYIKVVPSGNGNTVQRKLSTVESYVLEKKRPSFLQEYKNPCWLETKHTKTTCRHGAFYHVKFKEDLKPPILRCLPYFYMVGQPRSGLTNIYERLIRHPDIIAPHMKDIFWIQRHRFQLRCSSVNTYLDFFHEISENIRMNATIDIKTNTSYYNKVTGDCSGDVMWDNTRWQDLSGNENCTEPCLTNADYINHLNPSAKIIVALRDPIDRVYSDYLAQSVWLKYDPDNELFNKLVIEQIFQLEKCLINNHTIRYCVYNRDIYHSDSQVRVGIGLYAIHLEDWYRVFPKNQMHIIQFETFITDTENEMSRIFKFLNLQNLGSSEMKYIMEPVFKNVRTRFAEGPDMWIETRKILTKFYEPYNILLSKLLYDKKYLWKS
ncbi:carbohydrate sulfotransferase 15 [Patella vulgata]|uniref:carbohydrate sulfotransferase 15 n=1 Tax=Patella vulgata TaxID=6465 RepID=UPI0024A7B6A6|nr:carbohydrate sulfotransferase 15 [Patella vulgata]